MSRIGGTRSSAFSSIGGGREGRRTMQDTRGRQDGGRGTGRSGAMRGVGLDWTGLRSGRGRQRDRGGDSHTFAIEVDGLSLAVAHLVKMSMWEDKGELS
jgi:hypothetical protein